MFIPNSMIDTLFDYTALLKNEGALCELPENKYHQEVGIVGGGAAGVLAALELLKMGLNPVIYEVSPRLGGRLYSQPFFQLDDAEPPFAELGAMRIPVCSHVFFHYAKKVGLHCNVFFPTPGKEEGVIYYKKKLYEWHKGGAAPEPFKKLGILWELFINPYVEPVHAAWKKGDLETVQILWQSYIDRFKDKSLYQVLLEQSAIGLPENLDCFGSVGFGKIGLQPFFQFSFLEILRIVVNAFFSNNKKTAEGNSEFVKRLYELKVKTPQGEEVSLADRQAGRLHTMVLKIDYNPQTKNPILIYKDAENKISQKEFNAVIYTGSMSAAHLLGLTEKTNSGVYLFDQKIRESVQKSPMFYASKTYICTKNKFWKKLNLPPCILSDEITNNTFFMDYPFTKRGVICLSYSLGLNALKLTAVDPEHRVIIFKRVLEEICSVANKELIPLERQVVNIDWITEKFQNGAFKISVPGSDTGQHALYYQFQSVLTPEDKGVYLAGDGICWSSGWVEGALTTALNTVYSVAKRMGAQIKGPSPLDQKPDLFTY